MTKDDFKMLIGATMVGDPNLARLIQEVRERIIIDVDEEVRRLKNGRN